MVWCWVRVGRKLPLPELPGWRQGEDGSCQWHRPQYDEIGGWNFAWERYRVTKTLALQKNETWAAGQWGTERKWSWGFWGTLSIWGIWGVGWLRPSPWLETGCPRSLALPQWTCTKQKHITPTMDPLPKRYLPFSLLHHHMGQCREAGDGEEGEQRQEQTKERTLLWTWV